MNDLQYEAKLRLEAALDGLPSRHRELVSHLNPGDDFTLMLDCIDDKTGKSWGRAEVRVQLFEEPQERAKL